MSSAELYNIRKFYLIWKLVTCNCPEPVLDKTQNNPKQNPTQLQVFCDFETSFIQDPHTVIWQSHLKTLKLLYIKMQQETAEFLQCLDHAWEPREVPAATQMQKWHPIIM